MKRVELLIILILVLLLVLCNSYYNIKVYSSTNSLVSSLILLSSKSKSDKKNIVNSNSNSNSNDNGEKVIHNNIDKHNNNNLLTDPEKCMVRVAGSRTILPGDYVVHEEYGIGLYLGIRMVDLTPARKIRTWQPVVVVKYQDAEITWFQRLVDRELWLFRQSESGLQELSSIIDTKKWKRRKKNAEQNSKNMAINLIKMTTIRNELHRTPSVPTDDKYKEFEKRFSWDPTPDQLSCFNAIEDDMVKKTRPMDRLICGDVGFGKTEVAMRAIYRAVLSKKQVVLLAPTRVLAQQHYRVLCNRMPDVDVQLLRGGGGSDSLKTKDLLKDGTCQVVVGTHAVLGESVKFISYR
jgi:transcription-repair coupling factor (superfamily II helicase)